MESWFFSFLLSCASFFLPSYTYPRSAGHHGGKVWVEEPRGSWDSFRNSAGVVFSPRGKCGDRKVCAGGGVCRCLICGCSGLLYEILILEDIQLAYIWLACKSPPYLISRISDATHRGDWWLVLCCSHFSIFFFFSIFLFLAVFVKFDRHVLNILEMESRWIIDISSCDYLAIYIAIFLINRV